MRVPELIGLPCPVGAPTKRGYARARDATARTLRDLMRLLAFSDIHRDLRQTERLSERAGDVDVVVAAGDFGSVHRGLERVIDMLVVIETPTVLVPGNNETEDALREACRGWRAAHVLHGEGTEIGGVSFFGLGGGVPVTPWDWSFDLTEDEAAAALSGCPRRGVLVRAQRALAAAAPPPWRPVQRPAVGACVVTFPRGRTGPGAAGDPAWAAAA